MSEPREIIVELLRNIGGRKEVQEYLRHYTSVDARKFAVLRVGDLVLDTQRADIAAALGFLHRVGLYPIVVHGAGAQLQAALNRHSPARPRPERDGWLYTSPETLEAIRVAYRDSGLSLVDALQEQGTAARPITSGVFGAELIDEARHGLVGTVTQVDPTALTASIRAGQLPIVMSLGETSRGQLVDLSTDEAALALAGMVEPHKVIFLNSEGGIYDDAGRRVDAVNVADEAVPLSTQSRFSPRTRDRLRRIESALAALPGTTSVSVTRPSQLARELFTHRGAGTLLRRGERVRRYPEGEGVDRPRLRDLIEGCFGRSLTADYFDEKDVACVYLSEDYRGTAIVVREAGDAYLDKFAVTDKARGEGLGATIWRLVRADHPALFWRARRDNPVNRWYFDQADGTYAQGDWVTFWYGMDDFDDIQRCVARALAIPPTLSPNDARPRAGGRPEVTT
ncbi:MAG: acetylglutamate kinase [Myxococcota bacterium]